MTASWHDTIRMISFDADETLWDFQKVMRLALQRALTTDELKRTRDTGRKMTRGSCPTTRGRRWTNLSRC